MLFCVDLYKFKQISNFNKTVPVRTKMNINEIQTKTASFYVRHKKLIILLINFLVLLTCFPLINFWYKYEQFYDRLWNVSARTTVIVDSKVDYKVLLNMTHWSNWNNNGTTVFLLVWLICSLIAFIVVIGTCLHEQCRFVAKLDVKIFLARHIGLTCVLTKRQLVHHKQRMIRCSMWAKISESMKRKFKIVDED